MTHSAGALRRVFLENWGLKLISLALATMLWVFVVGEKSSEMSVSVPLELLRVPADLVIVNRLPENVRLRLSGPRTLLAAINPQQLSVALDLAGLGPGTTSFENLPARVRLPKRTEVTYVSPAVITIEADRKVQRRLPVRVRLRGDPAAGYRIESLRTDPPEVVLEGAARVLKGLRDVPTEVVDVAGVDESHTRAVDLALPDATLRLLTRGPVVASIGLAQEPGEREFQRVPVTLAGRRWAASPSAVDVVVAGGRATLKRLGRDDLAATVEGGDRAAARGGRRVVVAVPEGVRVISVNPKTVDVRPRPPEPAPGGPAPAAETGTVGE